MSEYLAVAYLKEWEEFSYENGASGQSFCCDVDVSFRAGSLPVLTEKIREFFGPYQATGEDCEIDWSSGDPGEIRVRLMEDENGAAADNEDIVNWKEGQKRLYDVIYFLSVVKEMQVKPEEVPS